jgi:hypothetical protein
MDKDLKEAIEKGRLAKEAKERAEAKAAQIERTERQKFIDSKMPAARKWVKEVLFARIAEEETKRQPYRNIYLGSDYVDGIPAEAIFEAAKKVKGLKPMTEHSPIYESGECVGIGETEYRILWESLDPNDNRNDR